MSKQVEWTIKGGIIGALVGVTIHLIFRIIFSFAWFILRFWYITVPLFAYFYIYHKIDYWWNNYAERDAIYDSFQKDRVSISAPQPVMTSGGVREIEFTINNNANARIYQVSATCVYEPPQLAEEDSKTDWIYTEYAYAEHIAPGQSIRVRLPLQPDGYLWLNKTTNLKNLRCEPTFQYEASDLFVGKDKRWNPLSQMDIQVRHTLKHRYSYGGDETVLGIEGRLINRSDRLITTVNVLCETTNTFGFTEQHGKHFRDMKLSPGSGMALVGVVKNLTYRPTAVVCRVNSVDDS